MLSVPIENGPHGFGEPDFRTYSISRAKVSALSLEHDDLDSAIDALVKTNTHDDLIVVRLKKRRLQMRDQIARLVAATQLQGMPDAAIPQSDVQADAPDIMRVAGPKPGGGAFALGVFASLSILITLALGWSDTADTVNQALAQIYLFSLLAAAHG